MIAFTDAELADARAEQLAWMDNAVTLVHQDSTSDSTICRYRADGTLTVIIPGLPAQPRYRFTFPYTDPLVPQLGDQAVLGTGRWAISAVLAPESFPIATVCYAYQRTDANGNPRIPEPNATVTVTRQDGTAITGGANRRVRMLNPAESVERVLASGGTIARWILDTPDADYRINDVVTLTQLDGFASPPDITTLFVRSIDPASSSGIAWLEIGLSADR